MTAEQGSRAIDAVITLLAVPASVFLIGHATALFPKTDATGWASAAAFIALILAYATQTGPGRRSGSAAFAIGAIAVAPLWSVWFDAILRLSDDSWYSSTFRGFRLGLSDRGFGHAGDIWLFLWTGSILLMVGVALAVRRMVVRSPPAPRHSGTSHSTVSTALKHGSITFGAVWLAMTVAGMVPLVVPSQAGGAIISLLVYTALLAAYARWTEAGRRSALAYFLGGAFPPLVCFMLLTPLLPHLGPSFLQSGGAIIFAGITVGFQFPGGADTPIEAYVEQMWVNLLLPIAVVIGGRAIVRYLRD